tara:strand:- start:39 stop:200 length:162 start_codon:yes stop_codon:yes gene_type:complete
MAKQSERAPMRDARALRLYQNHFYPQAERLLFTSLKATYMGVNQSWVSVAKPH